MVGIMDHNSDILSERDNLLKLMENKTKLEAELVALYSVLEQNRVGMVEALVDSQGFPRNDIDVYQVRHARHTIICLRNDLKGMMKAIEEGLHAVHAAAGFDANADGVTSMKGNDDCDFKLKRVPIAQVESVAFDSPAFVSGLVPDDLIIEFGSVNSTNFKTLEDISKVVQHSVNSTVNLVVQRGNCTVSLNLLPRAWCGRGFLGCTILPIDNNIER